MLFYIFLNYYIGLRGWQFLGRHINFISGKFYWSIFWIIAMSYFVGRLGDSFLPVHSSKVLKIIGSYWLAAMFYFLIVFLIIDVLRILSGWLKISIQMPYLGSLPPIVGGIIILFLVSGIVLYGSWNARNPRIVKYDITISKEAGRYNSLSAVLISDIHLGTIVDNSRLQKMIKMVNELEPDLILLPGDIIDEDVEVFVEQQMVETFCRLNSSLGTYAVLGNHEYIGGNAEDAVRYIQEAGIVVLRDSYIELDGSLYIVGRDDRAGARFTGQGRKDLSDILEGIDKSKPIILLDHQPFNLEEAREAGVDLQVSGHTHRGQLFPNHLITRKLFENDWGYLKKDDLQVIVSSGYGTWGPPIRVGNKPELVHIEITFKQN